AILDPYWIGGTEKHVKRTVLSKLILLKKDTIAPRVSKPSTDAALRILEEGANFSGRGGYKSVPFYNHYNLVKSNDRMELLKRHYRRLLDAAPLYVVNTERMGPSEAQDTGWKIIAGE
ncbi:MAG: hypothetical protein P9M15_02860, partial [Candidatus Electryoneaceae bacterium]|nr:hypothetical protein [Candidatus Electryoneaceae bacterium]